MMGLLGVCAFVCGLSLVRGQFMLSFGTPTPAPVGPLTYDPNCRDKLKDCYSFDDSSCRAPYETWARENCPQRCGYCMGPTTPAPACVNKLTNCDTYGKDVCSKQEYKTWVGENCRYYCRLCPADVLARLDSITTTIAPQNCVDKVDCRQYGANACASSFKAWSKENCPAHCGYCTGSGSGSGSGSGGFPVPVTSRPTVRPPYAVPPVPGVTPAILIPSMGKK